MMIKELDHVRFKEDFQIRKTLIPKGTEGTVVYAYGVNKAGKADAIDIEIAEPFPLLILVKDLTVIEKVESNV